MPEMLGFRPFRFGCSLAEPPNKWRTDDGRQATAQGHDTSSGCKVNIGVDGCIVGVED